MLINTLVECLLEAKVDDILNHPNYDSISNSDKESYLSKIPNKNTNHLSNFETGNNDMEVGDNYVYPSTVKGVADKLAKYKDDIPSHIKYAQEVLKHPLAKLDMNMLEAHHQQQMSKLHGNNI